MFEQKSRIPQLRTALILGALAAAFCTAYGQYPGRIEAGGKPHSTLRAIGVLEWTGEAGKPSASRLIPICVFDGENYQPGGLYLARPEPLAVESGTEYILQSAGIPQGLFDVRSAADMQGYWFGFGTWRRMPPPPRPHPLQRSKIPPRFEGSQDDSRPHFKNRSSSTGSGSSQPAQDDDRPHLERRNPQSGNDPGDTQTSSGSSSDQTPAADPDRPTLRRRSDSPAAGNNETSSYSGRETIVGGADPDRPHLTHEKISPTDPDFDSAKLTNTPVDLQRMIAVSDATDRDPHPFAYSWADPGDSAKMQAQMETLARKALAPPAPPTKHPAPRHTASSRRPVHKAASSTAQPLALDDERFAAYELTYNGGATLVFSAQSTDSAGKTRYITLIGQPDFYGTVHTIFQAITDSVHLDETPRMLLVDAVDPQANNRGDLVFELRSNRDRQFVIYRIIGGQAEQVFSTGSLPLTASPES